MNAEPKSCSCVHKQQDEMYGKGMRVHNPFKNKSGVMSWRCTVCNKER